MNYSEDMASHIDKFIKHPPRELIIWGASAGGVQCFEWLEKYNLERCVIGFVDSDARKWGGGGVPNNIPVHPPEFAAQNPTVPVVIGSQYVTDIYDSIPNASNRSVYVFESRKAPFDKDEVPDIPVDELYSAYRSDSLTRNQLGFTLMLRKSFKSGGIIPYSAEKHLPLFSDYWDSEELSLSQYNQITMVDGGAYTGDSIEKFSKALKERLAIIYAIEPDSNNIEILRKNIESFGLSTVTNIIHCGLSDKNDRLPFYGGTGDTSSYVSGKSDSLKTMVTISRLDDIIQDVKGKLCIKMDIQGLELNALKGAHKIIQQYKPELSICVYHKYNDILDIPKFIKTLVPEYNCILRGGSHLECYASVDRF